MSHRFRAASAFLPQSSRQPKPVLIANFPVYRHLMAQRETDAEKLRVLKTLATEIRVSEEEPHYPYIVKAFLAMKPKLMVPVRSFNWSADQSSVCAVLESSERPGSVVPEHTWMAENRDPFMERCISSFLILTGLKRIVTPNSLKKLAEFLFLCRSRSHRVSCIPAYRYSANLSLRI